MTKDKDLTEGRPFNLIFSFAASMMLGNVFQQLYTVVGGNRRNRLADIFGEWIFDRAYSGILGTFGK